MLGSGWRVLGDGFTVQVETGLLSGGSGHRAEHGLEHWRHLPRDLGSLFLEDNDNQVCSMICAH